MDDLFPELEAPDLQFSDRPPSYLEYLWLQAANRGDGEAVVRLLLSRKGVLVSPETVYRLTEYEVEQLMPVLLHKMRVGAVMEQYSTVWWQNERADADLSYRDALAASSPLDRWQALLARRRAEAREEGRDGT